MIPFPYSRLLLTRRPAAGGTPTDPNFANVSLLLHMNGSDGSTTFTDNSPNAFTISVFGNAQIDTAQSKFGGASGLFDGSGDYVTAPNDSDFNFGSGNFTVEGWVRKNRNATEEAIFSYGPIGQDSARVPLILMRWNTNNTLQALMGNSTGAGGSSFGNITSANTFTSTSDFYHFAYVRSGTTFYLFVNGNQEATTTSSTAQGTDVTSVFCLARDNRTNLAYFQGWLDDIRVTKGVARYTSAFTPPSAQFPDS